MADLLLLTPVAPSPSRQGSALRVGIALELLARRHRVFVVNTGTWGGDGSGDGFARRFAARYSFLPRIVQPGVQKRMLEAEFGPRQFAGIYVFRLAVAPLAVQVQTALGEPRARMILDLDDNEVERAKQFRKLREDSGDSQHAAAEAEALNRFAVFTKLFISRFDSILLSAEDDRKKFQAAFPLQHFVHLPNVVRLPQPDGAASIPGRLLFVGTLGYFPNEDAMLYFCDGILPLLRASHSRCVLRIVGGGATPRMEKLASHPEVQLAGFVPDLGPEYSAAQIAVVPLRAGSGTRIKILEAISYGCPVISTTIGAEGLKLRHGEEILIADTPAEFAAAIGRLLSDEELRRRLSRNAVEWLTRNHSLEHAGSVLDQIFDGAS